MSKKTNGNGNPPTTAQQLGSLIKSARDIMRKDKGLSGDLDRLPMLTWIMFLKFLDDMEQIEESRAKLRKEKYRPSIEAPYRWRDWAAAENGVTGPELLAFINHEECVRPDGKKGPGLFAYLRGLQGNGAGRRQVIATVFAGVINRMTSGYLLRDVINKVSGIHFLAKEELFTLGHLYESMLKEMRDAAGDSGEFYTPRAVVRFMVEVLDPKLGETILDPACGTGGFLVETYAHLEKQCKTVQDRKILQEKSIFGGEAKPLPYLLAQMNLLLHGLEAPRIDSGNSLRFPLNEIGDRDRVDVILTNPPFGGEEERGILSNFPEDKQTAETALLFLQLIMRKLRRTPEPGRAGVVVPNSVLADPGIASRIKSDLLSQFNLHTIVRLPNGVFAPYTPIPTNLLFFSRGGPTTHIWYYEVPVREGLREFTKTSPLDEADLELLRAWWVDRRETDQAWLVDAGSLSSGDHIDLDIRNPHACAVWGTRTAGAMASSLAERVRGLSATAEDIPRILRELAEVTSAARDGAHPVRLSDLLTECRGAVTVDPTQEYPNFGIYSFGRGTFEKQPINGLETSATTLYRVPAGAFVYSRLFAFEGAFALVPAQFDGWHVSNEYPAFSCITGRIVPEYLLALFRSPGTWFQLRTMSKGLGHRRQRVQPDRLLNFRIPLPPIETQHLIASLQKRVDDSLVECLGCCDDLKYLLPAALSQHVSGPALLRAGKHAGTNQPGGFDASVCRNRRKTTMEDAQ